jgi:hypothetical protein
VALNATDVDDDVGFRQVGHTRWSPATSYFTHSPSKKTTAFRYASARASVCKLHSRRNLRPPLFARASEACACGLLAIVVYSF